MDTNLYTAPNNKHAVRSDKGCIVLVSVPQPVEILKGPAIGA